MQITSKIAPCLWFDGQAEDAARFYTGIFKNSRIVPRVLPEMLAGGDQAKADRVISAVMKMKKLDIGELKRAFDNG